MKPVMKKGIRSGLLILIGVVPLAYYYWGQYEITGGAGGFPLDDSWIHLVFARSIHRGEGFSYGGAGAVYGSTSPLWVFILSMFHSCGPILAAQLWGIALYFGYIILTVRLIGYFGIDGDVRNMSVIIVIFTARMVWSSLSGMESLLYVVLSLWALERYLSWDCERIWKLVGAGFLIFLATAGRPECASLIPALVFTEYLVGMRRKRVLEVWKSYMAGSAAFVIPLLAGMLAMNYMTGDWHPTTLAAKSGTKGLIFGIRSGSPAELLRSFFYYPFKDFLLLPIYVIFDNLLLAAPMMYGFSRFIKEWRNDPETKGRKLVIPVTVAFYVYLRGAVAPYGHPAFQWGRYYTLLSPLILVIASSGLNNYLKSGRATSKGSGIFSLTIGGLLSVSSFYALWRGMDFWSIFGLNPTNSDTAARLPFIHMLLCVSMAAIGIRLLSGYFFQGKKYEWLIPAVCLAGVSIVNTALLRDLYVLNVKNIDQMQVDIGKFLKRNTSPDAVIAVDDIGAIAYFSERKIIDLKGIVTPEIIRYKKTSGNGGSAIRRYFRENEFPRLLAIFPDWHPDLENEELRLNPIYSVKLVDNTICGDETMVVYEVDRPVR